MLARTVQCLDAAALQDLAEGLLPWTPEVEAHLDGCARCRAAVANVLRARSQLSTPPTRAARPVKTAADRPAALEKSAQGGLDPTVTARAGRDAEAAREPYALLARGSVVGRYLVLERLGAGGMAVVYRAYDPELARRVALKVQHAPEAVDVEELRARMLREAQSMARLAHPNVVPIFDVGPFQDGIFLAMELVDGGTLAQWLRTHGGSWRTVLPLLKQAGEGLAAAHRAGVVHRDFKPGNVMVGADGRARVTDFGLARELSGTATDSAMLAIGVQTPRSDEVLTQEGTFMGTPAYMAPEQLELQPADDRSDQFSFCVAAWEALYGQRPFNGPNVLALRNAMNEAPKGATGDVPAPLRRALERGLAVRREDRFPSMAALLEALEPPGPRAPLKWVAAAGAVTLAGIAWLAWQQLNHAPSAAAPLPPVALAVPDAGQAPVAPQAVAAPPPDAGVKGPPRPVAKGLLSLDTTPWTRVYLGGRALGETPLLEVPVPAGRLQLRLVNEVEHVDTVVEVDVAAGRTTVRRFSL